MSLNLESSVAVGADVVVFTEGSTDNAINGLASSVPPGSVRAGHAHIGSLRNLRGPDVSTSTVSRQGETGTVNPRPSGPRCGLMGDTKQRRRRGNLEKNLNLDLVVITESIFVMFANDPKELLRQIGLKVKFPDGDILTRKPEEMTASERRTMCLLQKMAIRRSYEVLENDLAQSHPQMNPNDRWHDHAKRLMSGRIKNNVNNVLPRTKKKKRRKRRKKYIRPSN